MADYKTAIKRILKTEGGYVNDPADNGGETYKGISRKNWPVWVGWKIIQNHRICVGFPKTLDSDANLLNEVISFYKENFWDKVGGDFIASQTVANNLVDSAVNEGVKTAVRRAQGAVGLAQTGIIDDILVKRLNSMV